MHDLIAERKNNLQAAVVPSGHVFAKMAAGAALTLPAYRDEQWNGRTQLHFVQQTANTFPATKQDFRKKLAQLKAIIFNKNNVTINFTADAEGLILVREHILPLLDKMPAKIIAEKETTPQLVPVRTGIAVPTQVSYVARVLRAPAYTSPVAAMLMLSAKELSNSYLYKHIRVQGGAYGGMSSYDPSLGLFSFLSYRDPHITQTLKVFQDAETFLAENIMSSNELEKAIISTISMLDKPSDPGGRGYTALMRNFSGITDDMRQKFRDEIIAATPQQFKNTLADYFSRETKSASVAVYSALEKLIEANKHLDEKLVLEHLFES
jgi:hypothetical protein